MTPALALRRAADAVRDYDRARLDVARMLSGGPRVQPDISRLREAAVSALAEALHVAPAESPGLWCFAGGDGTTTVRDWLALFGTLLQHAPEAASGSLSSAWGRLMQWSLALEQTDAGSTPAAVEVA